MPHLCATSVVLVLVFYCAASIFWSDYPDVAFKRCSKLLGTFRMVLIVLTSADPVRAIKTVVTRLGLLLIPLSILPIKYYPVIAESEAEVSVRSHWSNEPFASSII
jgi:hypothetical protein